MVQLVGYVLISAILSGCTAKHALIPGSALRISLSAGLAASKEIVCGKMRAFQEGTQGQARSSTIASRSQLALTECHYLKSGKRLESCVIEIEKADLLNVGESVEAFRDQVDKGQSILLLVDSINGKFVAMPSVEGVGIPLLHSPDVLISSDNELVDSIRTYESKTVLLLGADSAYGMRSPNIVQFRLMVRLGLEVLGYSEMKQMIMDKWAMAALSPAQCSSLLERHLYIKNCLTREDGQVDSVARKSNNESIFHRITTVALFDKWLASAVGSYPALRARIDLAVSLYDIPEAKFQIIRRQWLDRAGLN